jgi:hypothetical protein
MRPSAYFYIKNIHTKINILVNVPNSVVVFVEQISTTEYYCHPPPFGNDCKQASLFYETNKYFHIKKNDTDYHLVRAQLCIGIYNIDLTRIRVLKASKLIKFRSRRIGSRSSDLKLPNNGHSALFVDRCYKL